MSKIALVLEGGAMRTLYTAGVLDVILEQHFEFALTIGTSSGSLTGINYITSQHGRTAHITINYCHDPEYISLRNRFRHDGVFNLDYLFQEARGRWDPLDEETYMASPRRFVVVATSCASGKPVYFEKPTPKDLPACLKASCAIPLLTRMIDTPQGLCLDGGISDSIPYSLPLREGFDKLVVVRTRHPEYRKKETPVAAKALYKAAFARHPQFLAAMLERPHMYNKQVEELEELERQGKAFLIAPESPIKLARAERNKDKLRALYEQGYAQTQKLLPRLREFMG